MTEICQDEVFILDHEGPVVNQGSCAGMPDLVVEPTAGYVSRHTADIGDIHWFFNLYLTLNITHYYSRLFIK